MKTLALRSIPIMGWLFLAYGIVAAVRRRPLRHPLARTVWWIDAFLSLVVHTAQIPAALAEADPKKHSRAKTAALTMIFGLTWWKTQPTTKESIR